MLAWIIVSLGSSHPGQKCLSPRGRRTFALIRCDLSILFTFICYLRVSLFWNVEAWKSLLILSDASELGTGSPEFEKGSIYLRWQSSASQKSFNYCLSPLLRAVIAHYSSAEHENLLVGLCILEHAQMSCFLVLIFVASIRIVWYYALDDLSRDGPTHGGELHKNKNSLPYKPSKSSDATPQP